MSLKLGELVTYLKGNNTDLKRTLAESKAETAATGDAMSRSNSTSAATTATAWTKSFQTWQTQSRVARISLGRDIDDTRAKIRQLAEEFGRTRDRGLLGDLEAQRTHLRVLEQALSDLGTAGVHTATTGLGFLNTAASLAGSGLAGLIVIALGVTAAIAAIVPVALLLGGALGALPALAGGALAAVAVLGLGATGLAEAFQDTASAGGSVVDRAHQIALAERRLTDANREATDAQEELNRARKTAAERMQDLNRNLAGARLDERAAINAVADARRDLERAELSENPERIARARLAYEQTEQSLADVRDRVEDLADEQNAAAQQGVEGSDEVKAALDRQRRSVEGISDAQYELNRAQTETSGGAVKQATVIAASAMAAIAAIKSLGGQYTLLRLDVQQRLFAGVDEEILSLSDAWLPTLRRRLGSMADMFNSLFKTWAETSRKPEFIANISAGWESVEQLIDRVFSSIAGPGLEAFGTLSRAADPFIERLGNGLGGIVDDFARWIDEADKDGSLTKFFDDAANFLSTAGSIGKDTMTAIGDVIGGIRDFGGEVDLLVGEKLQGLKDALGDVAGQIFGESASAFASLKKYVEDNKVEIGNFIDAVSAFTRDTGPIFVFLIKSIAVQLMISASAVMFLVTQLDRLADWFRRNGGLLTWLSPLGSLLMKSGSSPTPTVSGVPQFADGAYVPSKPGGTLAVMAEAGKSEFALPDDKLQAALDQAVARGVAAGDGASMPPAFEAHIYIDGQELRGMVQVEVRESNRDLSRRLRTGSGTR